MRRRTTVTAAAAVLTVGVAGGGYAVVTGDDEGTAVTGPAARSAARAALEATGGGTANAVERDGENGATWEVEVTEPDGDTVDVRLDEHYGVVVIEGDSERPDDSDSDR
jgi:hypothetical protein